VPEWWRIGRRPPRRDRSFPMKRGIIQYRHYSTELRAAIMERKRPGAGTRRSADGSALRGDDDGRIGENSRPQLREK
jgi:hypothetical protein